MKVVATADIHNSKPVLPDGDLLLIAGDLTQRGTLDELKRFRDWLYVQPHKHKVVIAGNHDFCLERKDQKLEAELIIGGAAVYLLDQEITIHGHRIYGTPWQPRFYDWAFNVDRGPSIAAKWGQIPTGLDILIVHGPPFGFGDRVSRGERVGCDDLRNAIEIKKPKYTLFGHIHEDTGAWDFAGVKVVNCSSDYGTKPAYEFEL